MLARMLRRETRRSPRFAVSASSKLRYSAVESAPVKIENLSAWGLRGSGQCPVKRGDWVSIEMPELGPIAARIAWARGDRFGAIFRKEVGIDPLVRKTRTLFERLPGLPIGFSDSSWDLDFEATQHGPSSQEAGGQSEGQQPRLERIARATRQAQEYIGEMKKRRGSPADPAEPSAARPDG